MAEQTLDVEQAVLALARVTVDASPADRLVLLALASALPGLVQDGRRLDWLETMVVNVREPTRYGSLDKFWANPADDEMWDGVFPDLRAKIDAELPAASPSEEQPPNV